MAATSLQTIESRRSLQAVPLSSSATAQGLYVHIPFCFHKCHYCDFYSLRDTEEGRDERHQLFLHTLIEELRQRQRLIPLVPKTIFVGGGTPTLMPEPHWRQFLAFLHDQGLLQHVSEFTVEANPETLTPELAHTLASGGVNRISIGAQSFHPHLLKTLERWHDPANVARSVRIARKAGIHNINLDLIFGIPGQSLKQAQHDLEAALELEPQHLSCYGLTYEDGTAMTQRRDMGQVTPIDHDLEADMYLQLRSHMAATGFQHYEISNWARQAPCPPADAVAVTSSTRSSGNDTAAGPTSTGSSNTRAATSPSTHVPAPQPDYRCQHNLMYWENQDWLGVGPSAASHIAGVRWKNLPSIRAYNQTPGDPPIGDVESLPENQRRGEALMLRLRLIQGVQHTWIQQHLPHDDPRHATIARLLQSGLLEQTPTHLRLTAHGGLLADTVISELL